MVSGNSECSWHNQQQFFKFHENDGICWRSWNYQKRRGESDEIVNSWNLWYFNFKTFSAITTTTASKFEYSIATTRDYSPWAVMYSLVERGRSLLQLTQCLFNISPMCHSDVSTKSIREWIPRMSQRSLKCWSTWHADKENRSTFSLRQR